MGTVQHTRRGEMGPGHSGMEKERMPYGEGHGGPPGGQYSAAHLAQMPHGYPGSAYMRHMVMEGDFHGDMDEFGEFGGGMKIKSVSSAVREVATRMNEVRLGHAHNGHMMPSKQHMDHEQMAAEYAQRGGGAEMIAAMRERMSMGGAAQMMRAHDAKMHQGYGGAMMMHLGMGGHRGMPYIAAQPPCLPFGAMHAGGYGTGLVGTAGAGGMESRHYSGGGSQAAKHNKYCHFCQHVKVRASGMLACCNKDCTRRFCEHCLSKSIGDDVNPQTSSAWVNGQWHCPVCRKLCCCAIGDCDKNHRHCKAYRYRVRRAEQQAIKRAGADPADHDKGPKAVPAAGGKGIKAEAAVEINDDKASSASIAAAIAMAAPHSQANSNMAAAGAHNAGAAPGNQRMRAHGANSGHTPDRDSSAALSAPPAASDAARASASVQSMTVSPAMMARMRQRRAGAVDVGAVDLNDVQTMADSWLRLLEEEENEADGDLLDGPDLAAPASFSDLGSMAGEGGQPARVARRGPHKGMGFSSGFTGSSDSLSRIMAGDDGAGLSLSASGSTPSLSGLVRASFMLYTCMHAIWCVDASMRACVHLRANTYVHQVGDSSMLSRNVSRDNLLLNDALTRNGSEPSLTEMVRNYSSTSLAAVLESSEGWDQSASPANADVQQAAPDGDLSFLSAQNVGAAGAGASTMMHQAYPSYHGAQGTTGKRMQRTNSHNMLVHEATSVRPQSRAPA